MAADSIKIEQDDLYSTDVEDQLAEQQALRRDLGEIDPQPLFVRVFYSSWFYLAMASAAGALLAWAALEPFLDDTQINGGGKNVVPWLLVFPSVAAAIGLFLGAAEGLMCRNVGRASKCGIVGLGIGFGGGLLALIPTGIVFSIMTALAVQFSGRPPGPPHFMPTGFGLCILIIGRGAAWSLASIPAGIGQGIALREKAIIINGLLGAVLGGLLGGLLFDPIALLFTTPDGQAAASRCIGFICIGLLVGLFVGLVEGWTKTAWLLMKKGPLAGKQFVVYRDSTNLGSSPKAEIYLFKDDAIEPTHAIIHNRGGRFEIEDCGTADGTYVNGIPIDRRILSNGDEIVLGKTVLEFAYKDS